MMATRCGPVSTAGGRIVSFSEMTDGGVSPNPLVIEKAQVDAELIRLTRLRSAHVEEQYRIRSNLRHAQEDAEAFTKRLANLRQDIATRQDTSGDKFIIELDGQETNNRGIAGELILQRAEKMKNRFGDDIRIGRFAGFDLFLRANFNDTIEVIMRGRNSYAARVTDTALGTIRSLEATVQGFEERASKLEADITDAQKRTKELETKVGATFEKENRYQQLSRRQNEIEEQLDLTKNQAPSQIEADPSSEVQQQTSQTQSPVEETKPKKRVAVRV
jgi:predicted  nucleic acid-binding Zn-ribbon protein